MTARNLVKKKNMPIAPSLYLKIEKQPSSLVSPDSKKESMKPYCSIPKKSPSLRNGDLNLALGMEPSVSYPSEGRIKKNPLLYNKYTNNSSRLLVSPKSSSAAAAKIKRDNPPASKCVLVGMPNKLIPIKKHFPVSSQEWNNSIYSYNKKNTILLPSIDKMVIKLIKSYFNSYLAAEKGLNHSPELELSVYDKTYVSKPEIKHTNSKVIITIFRYMVNKKYKESQGYKNVIPRIRDEIKNIAKEKK